VTWLYQRSFSSRPRAPLRGAGAGDNAVVISVSNVRLPDRLPGVCAVNGVIDQVVDGQAFRKGEPLSLRVPCGVHTHAMLLLPAVNAHGPQLTDPDILKGARLASAHIDDSGKLLWAPTRPYGHWGAIWGLRILNAVPLERNINIATPSPP
jgi:hypothetical protein